MAAGAVLGHGSLGSDSIVPLGGGPAHALLRGSNFEVKGWLDSSRALVIQTADDGSRDGFALGIDGRQLPLGKFPAGCGTLGTDARTLVCMTGGTTTDIWVADRFDPYFRP